MKYTTSFLVFPVHCNHLKELIFGGAFMVELDLAAAHCSRLALLDAKNGVKNSVTHKADFEFLMPAYVGDLLEFEANVTSFGVKSINIEVIVKRREGKKATDLIAKGKFVFISIGDVSDLTSHPKFLPYKAHGLSISVGEVND